MGGAVALVSGRPLAALDRLFLPLRLAAAGVHGLERRTADGTIFRPAAPVKELPDIAAALHAFAAKSPGVIVEDKEISLALHYRQAPGFAERAGALATELLARSGDQLTLQKGKMVLEFRPVGPDKGSVIAEFMNEAPFEGRMPVFIGDDETDESGFSVVNGLGGHSIRIGDQTPTIARWHADTVRQVTDWLVRIPAKLGHSAEA